MAERYPAVLGELIDAYRATALRHGLDEEGRASGECWVAGAGFGQLAERFGVAAELVEFDVDEHPLYRERPLPGEFEIHTVTLLDLAGPIVMVDWTAAQYGIGEFPLIRRWVEGEVPVLSRGSEPVRRQRRAGAVEKVVGWLSGRRLHTASLTR